MNEYFLILTQDFAEAFDNHQVGPNIFKYAVTNDGLYVTSTNALNVFPEIFSGTSFERIRLGASNFPENTFPVNSAFTIEELKTRKVSALEGQTRVYINSHYDPIERDALQMVFSQAMATSNVPAMERVGSVMAWCGTVMAYNAQKIAEIAACEDQAALDAVTIDFSQFDATDPTVSTGEFI